MENNENREIRNNTPDGQENMQQQSPQQPSQQPSQQPEPQVQYYYSSQQPGETGRQTAEPKKKMPVWLKSIIIILIIIAGVVILTTGCNSLMSGITEEMFYSDYSSGEVTTDFGYDYIGTVYVEGEMTEDYVGGYDHEYILNAIDAMIDDPENKGLILYVDTPGGTVFSADELYFKIKEYQNETGRPVYSSMQSMAASGGYYISAPCDKIIANRNCWTGSIGVTLGTFIDVSQLLEEMGIKTVTIASGENKGMGSSLESMTEEQKAIYQSLVDESYAQFVGIVAEGRGMDEKTVRKLADGRIYSALQAKKAGLVDQIGTYEEAVEDMKTEYGLEDCEVEEFASQSGYDIFSMLGKAAEGSVQNPDNIQALLDMNGKFVLSYRCNIDR